jgi:DMSO reductase anchor subunit
MATHGASSNFLAKGPVSPDLHGLLDYVLGLVLVIGPFVLDFDNDTAVVVSVVAGVLELIVATCTDWRRGIVHIIPPAVHGIIDHVFVVGLIAAPFIFGFADERTPLIFFLVLGIGGLLLVLATRFTADSASGRPGH